MRKCQQQGRAYCVAACACWLPVLWLKVQRKHGVFDQARTIGCVMIFCTLVDAMVAEQQRTAARQEGPVRERNSRHRQQQTEGNHRRSHPPRVFRLAAPTSCRRPTHLHPTKGKPALSAPRVVMPEAMEVEPAAPAAPQAVVIIRDGPPQPSPPLPSLLAQPCSVRSDSILYFPSHSCSSSFPELNATVALIERFVATREPRFMSQALRSVGQMRAAGKADPSHAVAALRAAAEVHMAATAPLKAPLTELLSGLPQPNPEIAAAATPPEDEEKSKAAKKKTPPEKLPESEIFIALMALLLLIDAGQKAQARVGPVDSACRPCPLPPPPPPHARHCHVAA